MKPIFPYFFFFSLSSPPEKRAPDTQPNLIVLEGKYNIFSGRGVYQCGICGKIFRNIGYIHIHLQEQHDIDEEHRVISEKQPSDGKSSVSIDASKKEETQTGENGIDEAKPYYQCDDCQKIFDQLEKFLEHKLTHFRSFECPHCQKTFTASKSLKQHVMTIHGGASNFRQ